MTESLYFNRVVCAEAMEKSGLQLPGEDTLARLPAEEQIQGEVLHEVVDVVAQALPVEGVEEGVTRPVGDATGSLCMAALAEVQCLATELPLVDLSFACPGERAACKNREKEGGRFSVSTFSAVGVTSKARQHLSALPMHLVFAPGKRMSLRTNAKLMLDVRGRQ
jgi:hypothetical protein